MSKRWLREREAKLQKLSIEQTCHKVHWREPDYCWYWHEDDVKHCGSIAVWHSVDQVELSTTNNLSKLLDSTRTNLAMQWLPASLGRHGPTHVCVNCPDSIMGRFYVTWEDFTRNFTNEFYHRKILRQCKIEYVPLFREDFTQELRPHVKSPHINNTTSCTLRSFWLRPLTSHKIINAARDHFIAASQPLYRRPWTSCKISPYKWYDNLVIWDGFNCILIWDVFIVASK